MAKSVTVSLARARRVIAREIRMRGYPLPQAPDHEIDFSDIPELTDEQLRTARRVGRPPVNGVTKRLIAIRIQPDVLAALRKQAARRKKPYQTYIHEILARAAKRG